MTGWSPPPEAAMSIIGMLEAERALADELAAALARWEIFWVTDDGMVECKWDTFVLVRDAADNALAHYQEARA